MANSIFDKLSYQVGQKYLPKLGVPAKVQPYMPAISAALGGDYGASASSLLDQLLRGRKGTSKISGGITLQEARRMFEEAAATDFSRKNLFHISAVNVSRGSAPNLNLFATAVAYAPHTLVGEAVRIGSAWMDRPEGMERVEARITTYDDSFGTVKRWFEALRLAYAKNDGTFGLPVDYLVKIRITHGGIQEGSPALYANEYTMRAGSIECDNSRREDGLQELQMSFVQFDPYVRM